MGKRAPSSKTTYDLIRRQMLFYPDFSYYLIPDWLFLSTYAQIFMPWLLDFGLISVATLAIVLKMDRAVIPQGAVKEGEWKKRQHDDLTRSRVESLPWVLWASRTGRERAAAALWRRCPRVTALCHWWEKSEVLGNYEEVRLGDPDSKAHGQEASPSFSISSTGKRQTWKELESAVSAGITMLDMGGWEWSWERITQ